MSPQQQIKLKTHTVLCDCVGKLISKILKNINKVLSEVLKIMDFRKNSKEREIIINTFENISRNHRMLKYLSVENFLHYYLENILKLIPVNFGSVISDDQIQSLISVPVEMMKARYGTANECEPKRNPQPQNMFRNKKKSQMNDNRWVNIRNQYKMKKKKKIVNRIPVPRKVIELMFPIFKNLCRLIVKRGSNHNNGKLKNRFNNFFNLIIKHPKMPHTVQEQVLIFLLNNLYNFEKLKNINEFKIICLMFSWSKNACNVQIKLKQLDKFNMLLKKILNFISNPKNIQNLEKEEENRIKRVFKSNQSSSNVVAGSGTEKLVIKDNALVGGPFLHFIKICKNFDVCFTSNKESLKQVIYKFFDIMFKVKRSTIKHYILHEWVELCKIYHRILIHFFNDFMNIQKKMLMHEESSSLNPPSTALVVHNPNNSQNFNQNNNTQLALVNENNNNSSNKGSSFKLEEIMLFMEGCVVISNKNPNDNESFKFLSFLLKGPIENFFKFQKSFNNPVNLLKSLCENKEKDEVIRCVLLFRCVCTRIRDKKKAKSISSFFIKILPVLLNLVSSIHKVYDRNYLKNSGIPMNVCSKLVFHNFENDRVFVNQLFLKLKQNCYKILGYCCEFIEEFWKNDTLIQILSKSVFLNFNVLMISDQINILKSFVRPYVEHIPKQNYHFLSSNLLPILMNVFKMISGNLSDKSKMNQQQFNNRNKILNQESWNEFKESKLYSIIGKIFNLFSESHLLQTFLERNPNLFMLFCEITIKMLYCSSSMKYFYLYKRFFVTCLEEFKIHTNSKFNEVIGFHLLKGLIYKLTFSIDIYFQSELVDMISRIFVSYYQTCKYPIYIFQKINKLKVNNLVQRLNSSKLNNKMKKKTIKQFLAAITGRKLNLVIDLNEAKSMM